MELSRVNNSPTAAFTLPPLSPRPPALLSLPCLELLLKGVRYPVLRYPDLTELQRLYEESPGPDTIVEVRLWGWGLGEARVRGTFRAPARL